MAYVYARTNCVFILLCSCNSFIVAHFVRRPTLLVEYTGYLIFRKIPNDERQYLLIKKPKNEHWQPPEALTVYMTTPAPKDDDDDQYEKEQIDEDEDDDDDDDEEEEEEEEGEKITEEPPRPYELYDETGLTHQDVTFIPNFSRSYEYFTDEARVEITYTMAKILNPDAYIRLTSKKCQYKWATFRNVFNMTDNTRRKAFDDAEEYLRRGGYNAYF